jgi:carbon-monoxide dehydrogenase large subunit
MERLIDRAAHEMGIDPVTIRKRNLVKPSEIPYSAANGFTYDSGDFPGVFTDALALADHANFAKRKRDSKKSGKLRGIAFGSYLEITAPPNVELSKITFNDDDTVTVTTGTLDFGQGHASAFAQVLTTSLGVPFEAIKLVQGDSDVVHSGNGTGGSRSITASGTAIVQASQLVIEKGKKAAAHLLEASEGDIEFADGHFTITGTDKNIPIMELAARLRATRMPEDVPASLDVDHISTPIPSTFPNGCHVAEVEIDPETGVVRVVRYSGVNDFGTVVNPMLVAGQIHGGVVQGIGQALMECVSYDEGGQPITGSLMDYALPRAEDAPPMTLGDHPSPTTSNPIGTKGCGEAGCAGGLVTIVNAVLNALSEYGVTQIDMPLTSEKIWRAIRDAKQKAA